MAVIEFDLSGRILDANDKLCSLVGYSLDELNTAVNQKDQQTQRNAAMVDETNAASHGLAREAATLFRLVDQFKVGDDTKRHNPALRLVANGLVAS